MRILNWGLTYAKLAWYVQPNLGDYKRAERRQNYMIHEKKVVHTSMQGTWCMLWMFQLYELVW